MQLIPRGSDLKTLRLSLFLFLDFFLSFSIFIHFHILFVRAALSSGGRPRVEPKLLGDRCPSAKCSLKATERGVSWENCRILPGYFPPGTAKENQSSEKNPNWHFGLVHTCAAIDWKCFFRGDLFFFLPLTIFFTCTCTSGVVMRMIKQCRV